MVEDENILTYKTVYFQSIHFKIICLLSPPSLNRAQPTDNLGCSLVRPNVTDWSTKTHNSLSGNKRIQKFCSRHLHSHKQYIYFSSNVILDL